MQNSPRKTVVDGDLYAEFDLLTRQELTELLINAYRAHNSLPPNTRRALQLRKSLPDPSQLNLHHTSPVLLPQKQESPANIPLLVDDNLCPASPPSSPPSLPASPVLQPAVNDLVNWAKNLSIDEVIERRSGTPDTFELQTISRPSLTLVNNNTNNDKPPTPPPSTIGDKPNSHLHDSLLAIEMSLDEADGFPVAARYLYPLFSKHTKANIHAASQTRHSGSSHFIMADTEKSRPVWVLATAGYDEDQVNVYLKIECRRTGVVAFCSLLDIQRDIYSFDVALNFSKWRKLEDAQARLLSLKKEI